jgi:adenine deaminase
MTSLFRLRRSLVAVAMGREPADLVVRNGRWVCVQSGEIIDHTDIAIKDGHFAYVGPDAGHCIGPATEVMEAKGRYLVPGLLDAHMHVESGMVTVTEFVRAVMPHGTTGMFIDPHEIANVFGLKGVKLMVDEAAKQPIHVWVEMPSCVPSAPGLETPGAAIGPAEVAEAMTWERIIGLGEMMSFSAVYSGDRKLLREIVETEIADKTVGGHYASPDLGVPFSGYVAGGAEDDHEGTRLTDAIARVRQGMKPMLRYGSAWHDVASQAGAITRRGLDSRRFILCTDDSHAQTLAHDGHMDRVVRHAIENGLPAMTAIQMATLNTAEHFRLDREMGMIAPGRSADLVLVSDLRNFKAELVIGKGKVVARDGKCAVAPPRFKYPRWAEKSVHLGRPLVTRDFVIKSPNSVPGVKAHVIGVIENQAPTRHVQVQMHAENGEVQGDPRRDICKVAVIRRHTGTQGISRGFVTGFGFKGRCAVASTVVHDCHHLIVVGTDDDDMAMAANELRRNGGGQVVVQDGRVIGMVELAIAGLMSKEKVDIVAEQAESVLAGFRACGCRLNNPNMQLSLLALAVIPDLRLTDKGLVDVTKMAFIPVLERA